MEEYNKSNASKNFAMIIHRVEKEFGIMIDYHYPYLKLLSQIKYLNIIDKKLEQNG